MWLERTELLLGTEKLERLKNANVLVAGLGGVGATAAELICRAGVGKMTLVDYDTVEPSNRNRQLPALVSTTGKFKTEILSTRFYDINPEIDLTVLHEYIHEDNVKAIIESQPFDFVVDAIDTLFPKVLLISNSIQHKLKIVSSMGAGGKLDPSKVQVSDISKSYNCPLARMLRKRLSKMGIKNGVTVVFSSEGVVEEAVRLEDGPNKKSTVGTISYIPIVFGCFAASVVIRNLLELDSVPEPQGKIEQ